MSGGGPASGPEVSVIVPAYNAAATLPAQLDALARQRVDFDWELLVCDNGSTDGTAAVVAGWRGRIPGLAVVPVPGVRGAAAARNGGAARASGRLLAFCDADDVVADGWLAAIRAGLGEAPLVVGPVEPARLAVRRRPTVSWVTQPPITLPYGPGLPAGATNNLGVTAAAFAEVGGFDEALLTAEDVDLCWRVQLAGHALAVRPDAVVHVRKRTGLRAIYRQARSYGAGGAALRRKYGAPPAVAPGAPWVLARAAASALRGHPGDAAWRVGEWAGVRAAASAGSPDGPGTPPVPSG